MPRCITFFYTHHTQSLSRINNVSLTCLKNLKLSRYFRLHTRKTPWDSKKLGNKCGTTQRWAKYNNPRRYVSYLKSIFYRGRKQFCSARIYESVTNKILQQAPSPSSQSIDYFRKVNFYRERNSGAMFKSFCTNMNDETAASRKKGGRNKKR